MYILRHTDRALNEVGNWHSVIRKIKFETLKGLLEFIQENLDLKQQTVVLIAEDRRRNERG